jgi:hypothetical protein
VQYGYEEASHRRYGKSDTQYCRPEAAGSNDKKPDHNGGNGLDEEEQTDGGNGAIADTLPEVEVDVAQPYDHDASDKKGGSGKRSVVPAYGSSLSMQHLGTHVIDSMQTAKQMRVVQFNAGSLDG